jgi:hypothetical protein
VYTRDSKLHQNTLTLYVGRDASGFHTSIGDLPFQLALLSPHDTYSDLEYLSTRLEELGIERLINPREMLVSEPALIKDLLTSSDDGEDLNPGRAWRRFSGF